MDASGDEYAMALADVMVTPADDEHRKAIVYNGRELCRVNLEEAVVLLPVLAYIVKEEDESQGLGLGFEMPWEV